MLVFLYFLFLRGFDSFVAFKQIYRSLIFNPFKTDTIYCLFYYLCLHNAWIQPVGYHPSVRWQTLVLLYFRERNLWFERNSFIVNLNFLKRVVTCFKHTHGCFRIMHVVTCVCASVFPVMKGRHDGELSTGEADMFLYFDVGC